MWMNEIEIQGAVQRISKPASFVMGATFLSEFCNLINCISDGWPYWSYGTKCSNDLQTIIDKAQWPINQLGSNPDTRKVKPAIKKVLTFLRRCKQTKDTEAVKDFIAKWDAIIT